MMMLNNGRLIMGFFAALVLGIPAGCGPTGSTAGDGAIEEDGGGSADARTDGGGPVGDGAPGAEAGTDDGGPTTETVCDDLQDNDGDGLTDCEDLDCSQAPVCDGQCALIPPQDPVPEAPLSGQSPAGTFESVTAGGFHDDYVYNQAGALKIGVRREWGGTIIFFGMDNGSPGMNNTNVIDANDTGREVQVAFYDPDRHMQNCAWNASCQTTPSSCPFSITYLGWNPVQGGNRCNNGSGYENVDMTDGTITVTTVPLFWNPNWDRQDCSSDACNDPQLSVRPSDVRVIQRIRFVRPNVVELDYTVINLAAMDHAPTAQEFPTVYTANGIQGPNLLRLFNSAGTEIAIDTQGNDGFFYKNFTSTGGWVTMQNDNLDYGVGMYTENRLTDWQGWQLLSLPFNNFRPLFTFGIPALGTIRARSYLIIGSLGTVTAEAQWLDDNLPPFGVLDSPVADATLSGTVNLHGWVLDNRGVSAVSLIIDNGAPIPLTFGTGRPDVCAVWPSYDDCNAVGYQGSFDTQGLSNCPHLLEINAVDTDGNQRIIARRRVYVSN